MSNKTKDNTIIDLELRMRERSDSLNTGESNILKNNLYEYFKSGSYTNKLDLTHEILSNYKYIPYVTDFTILDNPLKTISGVKDLLAVNAIIKSSEDRKIFDQTYEKKKDFSPKNELIHVETEILKMQYITTNIFSNKLGKLELYVIIRDINVYMIISVLPVTKPEINKVMIPNKKRVECFCYKTIKSMGTYNVSKVADIMQLINKFRVEYYQNIKPVIVQLHEGHDSCKYEQVARQCAYLVRYASTYYETHMQYKPIYLFLKSKQVEENKLLGSVIVIVHEEKCHLKISIPRSTNIIYIYRCGMYVRIMYEIFFQKKYECVYTSTIAYNNFFHILKEVETLIDCTSYMSYLPKLHTEIDIHYSEEKHKYIDVNLLSEYLNNFINKLNNKLDEPWKLSYDDSGLDNGNIPFYEYCIKGTNIKICLETIQRIDYSSNWNSEVFYYELHLVIYECDGVKHLGRTGNNILERVISLDCLLEMPNGVGLMLRVINMFKN